jgi:hypothetical protein
MCAPLFCNTVLLYVLHPSIIQDALEDANGLVTSCECQFRFTVYGIWIQSRRSDPDTGKLVLSASGRWWICLGICRFFGGFFGYRLAISPHKLRYGTVQVSNYRKVFLFREFSAVSAVSSCFKRVFRVFLGPKILKNKKATNWCGVPWVRCHFLSSRPGNYSSSGHKVAAKGKAKGPRNGQQCATEVTESVTETPKCW